MQLTTYALYDTKDFECLVAIGTVRDIARYLGTSMGVVRSGFTRKVKFKGRYEMVKIKEDDDVQD